MFNYNFLYMCYRACEFQEVVVVDATPRLRASAGGTCSRTWRAPRCRLRLAVARTLAQPRGLADGSDALPALWRGSSVLPPRLARRPLPPPCSGVTDL